MLCVRVDSTPSFVHTFIVRSIVLDSFVDMKEFLSDVLAFATLSHTWAAEADEVTFQEFRKRKKATRAKAGYQKIQKAVDQAGKDESKRLWVDSCCITNAARS